MVALSAVWRDVRRATPQVYGKSDESGDLLSDVKRKLKISVSKCTEDELVFDMVGIDAPIANALRRILIAEVPTMAIERVYVSENTSVIQDEVLSHRLGLIPLRADPREFEFMTRACRCDACSCRPLASPAGACVLFCTAAHACYVHDAGSITLSAAAEDDSTSVNTIVFKLQVVAGDNPDDPDNFTSGACRGASRLLRPTLASRCDHAPVSRGTAVYSSQLEWQPVGTQAETFAHDPIRPVHDDILIARLKPGQVLSLEAHATKGRGKEHAKWSPVGTASYRLLPELLAKEEVVGKVAEELVAKCPMNVYDIEDTGRITAARPRDCTVCRECVRGTASNGSEWRDLVTIHRVMDHFICTCLLGALHGHARVCAVGGGACPWALGTARRGVARCC